MLDFFDNLFFGDLRKTNIKVTFINNVDNSLIEIAELKQIDLPESFKDIQTVFIENEEWHITSAFPEHAKQYTLDKKLTLRIAKINSSRQYIDHPSEQRIQFEK